MNEHSPTQDRPLLGILLMLGFCVMAPIGDALAKLLSTQMPMGQLVLTRFVVQALILVPIVVATRRQWRMSARVLRLVVWRTLLHIAGIACMFTSLRYLPLADAVAIAFVMPFIMLILGKFFLNEDVGLRRILACVVGFSGTLMVIQPSFADVGAPALLPVAVAFIFAFFMLITRKVAKDVDPIAMQVVSGVIATALLAPALLLGSTSGIADLAFVVPDTHVFWLLLAIGVAGTVAHLLMTWSLRYAPSTTLAPMQYIEIPLAALVGWIVFSDWPNGLAALGICVTMGAGLYVMLRERATLRRSLATP
ncbi:DMT family transporter [Shimia haliotis]|uniref:Threonine/homoserine efflux transporter RhtA n=1 Tax=Shimia haliotis TaxID=1280847 RepID=A0A1I4FYA2_9RHOB|nr:DMT family transporter [Shimia haliotis]SFL21947.1 Threonine/homoserine efflux transporter RhtA [Shimia haliotis]